MKGLGVGKRAERVDERDTIFSRMALVPGSRVSDDYYARHPGRWQADDALRALPELCGQGSRTYHPENSLYAPAIFRLLARWRPLVETAAAGGAGLQDPHATSERLKGLARYYGAHAAGITALAPEFTYSHAGRGDDYGREIAPSHRYALVFTVAMDYRHLLAAPGLPVVAESARQYLEAAKVALAVAANVSALGGAARAHLDGSYLAVLPPLAVLAGLGEIGRPGILVTPDLGPRVRLGMVTTDLPLSADRPRPLGLQEFCRTCGKCARNCPAQAISREPAAPAAGWQVQADRCYRFWRQTGTDCAICLISCPYSRPLSPLQRLLRAAAGRSAPARRIAPRLDDIVYGRRPFRRWAPEWFADP